MVCRSNSKPVHCPHTLRRGSVSIALVIALALLGLVVMGAVLGGSRDHDLSARRVEGAQAFYTSEAALQMATREVVVGLDADGNGTIGGLSALTLGAATASVSRTDAAPLITLEAVGQRGSAYRRSRTVIRQASSAVAPGVKVEVWVRSSSMTSLAAMNWATTPNFTGVMPDINLPARTNGSARFPGQPSSNFSIRATARIQIPTTGAWTFSTTSDDGSDLTINGTQVVINDFPHAMTTRSGTITLNAGLHDVVVRMFENSGFNGLIVSWQGPGVATQIIPASAFFTDAEVPPLCLHSTVQINGDNTATAATIDAFNSLSGPYGGSNILTNAASVQLNSTASNAWQMSSGARLLGNAIVGPGGNPATVIVNWSGSSISGTKTAATQRIPMFIATPTVTMPASSGSLAVWSGTYGLSGTRRFSSLTIGNASVLDVTGNCVVQVDGAVSFQNTAQVRLLSGATLTLYISGALNIYNQALVNVNTGDPSRLRIFMTGTSNVQITDQSQLVAYISNPFGSLLVYPNSTIADSFSGRFYGNAIQMSDKAKVHLDVASGTTGGSSGFDMLSWTQVQP